MSSTSAPFGFRASFHNSGQIRPKAYVIASAYAASIYSGDPVKLVDAGTIQLGTSDGTRTGTVDGIALLGIFAGVEYRLCLMCSMPTPAPRALTPFRRLLVRNVIGLLLRRVVPPRRACPPRSSRQFRPRLVSSRLLGSRATSLIPSLMLMLWSPFVLTSTTTKQP